MTDRPGIQTTLDDSANSGVVYHVMAYRPLSKAELIHAVRTYLAGRKKSPSRGSRITIVTVIGCGD